MFQLYSKHRRLDRVHAAVPAEFLVQITLGTAVISQMPHMFRKIGVCCRDQPGIAESTEILCGIKTECSGDTERPCIAPAPFRSNRLGRILDHYKLELLRELLQRIDIRALTIKMNRQQRANFVRPTRLQSSLDFFWIKIKRAWINVHENRPRSGARDRTGRSKKTESARYDAIARLSSRRGQRQPQGIRPRSATHRSRNPDEIRDLTLKLLDFSTENELL